MNMKIKNSPYLVLGLFLAVILLLIGGGAYPLYKNIQRHSEQITLYASQGSALALQSAQISAFEKQYTAYQDDMKKIQQLFVDPIDSLPFVEFLENTASRSGVKLQVLSVSPQNTQNQTITMAIMTQGEFLDTLTFFKRLELGSYLVMVKKVSVHKPENGPNEKNPIAGVVAQATLEAMVNPANP
jgi:Tfp pilus assembly protein PilN